MTTTVEKILEELNEDQRKAVVDFEGACFIVAGPGAGKTKTIVSRTNYMIEKGVDAESIMLFTFTNKAAKEIKERIAKAIGPQAEKLKVGTYHSVCNSFLRQYYKYTPYSKNFSIFDSEDTLDSLKELTKGYEFDNKKAREYISSLKDKLIKPEEAMRNAQTTYDRNMATVYSLYQAELLRQDAMDFDDLICQTIYMFESQPETIKAINKKYKYVTADEFHDSSVRDIRLMDLLAGKTRNICFILDDEQSIYSFRGADIEAVLGVRDIFQVKTFVLKENYRSTQCIINGARSLISKNAKQIPKTIYTNNEVGNPIVFFEEEDRNNEAIRVTTLAVALKKKYKINYKDIAILYRASYLTREIEDKFLTAGLPYKIVGGLPFYARKEIKDILSYARFIYNPFDFQSFKRCVTTPKRGVSDVTINKILDYARNTYAQPIHFIQACQEIELTGVARKGIESFNEIMDQLIAVGEKDTASQFIKHVMEFTEYRSMLYAKEENAEERMANLIELQEIAHQFETLEDMLQNSSLGDVDEDENGDDDRIQLMTMHASKGLEFPAVIIIGACETICPYWRATTPKAIEEERRLMYVGMTRAQKYLFLTSPRFVMNQGQRQRVNTSRFVKEIDKKYIQKY